MAPPPPFLRALLLLALALAPSALPAATTVSSVGPRRRSNGGGRDSLHTPPPPPPPHVTATEVAARGGSEAGPPPFPLFMQCDDRWGADEMGVVGDGERSTICGEGCAMSCLAMILSGVNVSVFGTLPATPQTLNAWLLINAGYTCIDGDCNDLVLDAVQRLDPRVRLVGYLDVPAFADLAAGVAAGQLAYIARIVPDDPHFVSHFILLTGVSPSAPTSNL